MYKINFYHGYNSNEKFKFRDLQIGNPCFSKACRLKTVDRDCLHRWTARTFNFPLDNEKNILSVAYKVFWHTKSTHFMFQLGSDI